MSHLIALSISLPTTCTSSHWPKTLGTCGAPSKPEANDIENVISLGHSDISNLDVEIDRVQEVLKQLSRRRNEISEHIMNHSALLSAVRKIPNEVLREIFIYCLPWVQKEGRQPSSFRRDEAPILLGQICSRWRAVALSTQALWSFIQISYSPVTVASDMAKMSLWLERSGTCPLSLVLREHKCWRGDDYSQEERALMLGTIMRSSHRWQDVDICVLPDTIEDLSPIRNALPLLQSLALQMYGTRFAIPGLYDAFELAPALRTVDLRSDLSLAFIKLPWTRLTHFSSHNMVYTPTEYLEILKLCPDLTVCHFDRMYNRPVDPTTSHLRHCRLIDFRIAPETNHGSFFDCLTLPALRAVRLDSPQTSFNNWPRPVAQFLNLLRRSLCTLEKFTYDIDCEVGYIFYCLKSMPDLKELQIIPALDYYLPQLLQYLTLDAPDEAEACLCPKLQAIQLSVDRCVDVGALGAFIRPRRNIKTVRDEVVQFKCIQLQLPHFRSWHPETLLRDLKEFQDDGLDILVGDRDGELRQVVLQ